jgi:CubicO group peptidase (beta-lactamase class C family)
MNQTPMLLLKIAGISFVGLICLLVAVMFAFRMRPKLESWYYQSLSLKPDSAPKQFDQSVVNQLDAHFSEGHFGNVHSFIVWQSGEKLYEYNQLGATLDELFKVWSISKSVVSAAYGAAIQQGFVDGVDSPIAESFPEFAELYAADPLRNQIKVVDLLTMRSGFKWQETGNPSDYRLFARSNDWMAYMAEQEMARPAGELFVYNTANTIVLAEIISRQVDQPFEAFVVQSLFSKMGITNWRWEYGPNQVVQAGGGLNISPNDMLKIGQLYLNNGMWEGEQLVSPEWIQESVSVKTSIPGYLDYGYHWWMVPDNGKLVESLKINDAFFASGLGGNYIWVVPHLDLVVVVAARDRGGEMELSWPAIRYFVFPALSGE